MKKKSMITMLAAIALVGVVGIGATYAYYTSATDTITNTFTTGDIEAQLKEYSNAENTAEWADATDGKNMYPGQSVIKKPVLTIKADSADCYGYLKVEGIDALVQAGFAVSYGLTDEQIAQGPQSGINPAWKKISTGNSLDGTYMYVGTGASYQANGAMIGKQSVDNALPALFDKVTYLTTSEGMASSAPAGSVKIIGCALQAEGFESGTAAYETISGTITGFQISD